MSRARLVEVVAGDAEQDRLAPAARTWPYAVYEFELRICPGPTGWPGGDQLAPRRDDGDTGSPRDRDRVGADGGEKADLSRAEACAARQDDVADGDVLASAAHVGGRLHRLTHCERVARLAREFHRHDRVDTGGQRRAGHDLGRFAGPDGLRHVAPGGDLDGHSIRRAPGAELVTAQRVAVHRGVVEGWDLLARDDVGGGGAAEGVEQRDLLRRERDHGRQDAVDGLLYGKKGTHHLRSLNCLRRLVNSGNGLSDTQSEQPKEHSDDALRHAAHT